MCDTKIIWSEIEVEKVDKDEETKEFAPTHLWGGVVLVLLFLLYKSYYYYLFPNL